MDRNADNSFAAFRSSDENNGTARSASTSILFLNCSLGDWTEFGHRLDYIPQSAACERRQCRGDFFSRWKASAFTLSWRRDYQPGPAGQKTKPAQRRDCAEPAHICQRHHVQTPAEQNDSSEQKKPRAAIHRAKKSEREKRDRMNEMIEHRFVPGIEQAVTFDGRS